ncbi:ExbD/TolR family protein [Anaeromyxobacter diazotrophicus]|uniref:Biopolymer transporter ExbD n=1 Tax=Anaeromyxobacter diazotrophicus TaxID=2590199 RepID=A0A7I9VIL0_9BACT|nr:biopolymer transporter ExbD [Anaeromyxobacter diazotrophicus]GEJ55857.1 biopolymer transporter ExbD [Anaeromyxobacter diazotrophicus]
MAVGGPSGGGDEDVEGGGGIFADINITPLTDIFLVLLIIFMVTTTAIAEQGGQNGGLKVSLPRAGKSAPSAEMHDLAVAVLEDGRTVVGGKVVDEEELSRLLERAHGDNPDTLVLVQADQGVAHGKVVAVMDLARRHGLSRLAIATREDPAAR